MLVFFGAAMKKNGDIKQSSCYRNREACSWLRLSHTLSIFHGCHNQEMMHLIVTPNSCISRMLAKQPNAVYRACC